MPWLRRTIGVLGLLLSAAAMLRLWRNWEHVGWRAVDAHVVERQVPEAVLRAAAGRSASPSAPALGYLDGTADSADAAAGVRVRYRYAVGRRDYLGSQVLRGTPAELAARLAELRPGARLTAYYAPAQPWRSALARHVGAAHWGALAGGLLLLAAAVAWPGRDRARDGRGDRPWRVVG
jgi:hypothetical protein